jgi:hypothetical protein
MSFLLCPKLVPLLGGTRKQLITLGLAGLAMRFLVNLKNIFCEMLNAEDQSASPLRIFCPVGQQNEGGEFNSLIFGLVG